MRGDRFERTLGSEHERADLRLVVAQVQHQIFKLAGEGEGPERIARLHQFFDARGRRPGRSPHPDPARADLALPIDLRLDVCVGDALALDTAFDLAETDAARDGRPVGGRRERPGAHRHRVTRNATRGAISSTRPHSSARAPRTPSSVVENTSARSRRTLRLSTTRTSPPVPGSTPSSATSGSDTALVPSSTRRIQSVASASS